MPTTFHYLRTVKVAVIQTVDVQELNPISETHKIVRVPKLQTNHKLYMALLIQARRLSYHFYLGNSVIIVTTYSGTSYYV